MATHYSYSVLENPKDRRLWWAIVQGGHKKSDTTERLSTHYVPETSLGSGAEAGSNITFTLKINYTAYYRS